MSRETYPAQYREDELEEDEIVKPINGDEDEEEEDDEEDLDKSGFGIVGDDGEAVDKDEDDDDDEADETGFASDFFGEEY